MKENVIIRLQITLISFWYILECSGILITLILQLTNPALLCSLAGGDARHSPLPWHLPDWSHHAWHSPSGLCWGNLGHFFGTLNTLLAFPTKFTCVCILSFCSSLFTERKGKQYAVLLTIHWCEFLCFYLKVQVWLFSDPFSFLPTGWPDQFWEKTKGKLNILGFLVHWCPLGKGICL